MTTLHEEPPPAGGPEADPVPSTARRVPRWIKVVIGLLAVLVVYSSFTFVQVWQASREDHARRAQAIVVLGAAQYDGRPSPVLKARLDHALSLYRTGIAPLVVVTGGRRVGDRFTEASAGYAYLRRQGVPANAILQEVHGRTTFESIAAAAQFLHRRNMRAVILVSDPFHAKRLGEVAGEVGLDANVSPVKGSSRLVSLLHETAAVGIGRVISYRRLDRFDR